MSEGDGGRMDDETLARLVELSDGCDPWSFRFSDDVAQVVETAPDGDVAVVGDFAVDVDAMLAAAAPALVAEAVAARAEAEALQGDLNNEVISHMRTKKRLGDTRARLAAVETEATRLRDHAEAFLYDGDHDVALPGYVEVYGVADALAALGATDQAGGTE